MQESIFDLFGSRHSTAQKHNSRQATSVNSVSSLSLGLGLGLGVGLSATSNLKQKSSSVRRPTSLKRALGDVSNKLQQCRPLPCKEENQRSLSFSCQQKSPSFPSGNKALSQKLWHKNDEPDLKNLAPVLKNLNLTCSEVDSKASFVWNAKPEVFPGPEITEVDDDYEDFFPKRERLTNEDIYRVMSCEVAEEPKPLITPPDVISLLPLPDVTFEDVQSLEVDLLTDIAEEQVSLPDILWEIEDKVDRSEGVFRYTL